MRRGNLAAASRLAEIAAKLLELRLSRNSHATVSPTNLPWICMSCASRRKQRLSRRPAAPWPGMSPLGPGNQSGARAVTALTSAINPLRPCAGHVSGGGFGRRIAFSPATQPEGGDHDEDSI